MEVAALERARAIAVAEQRYKDRIRALQDVKELAVLVETYRHPSERAKRGDVVTRVREVVDSMPPEFSLRELTRSANSDEHGHSLAQINIGCDKTSRW